MNKKIILLFLSVMSVLQMVAQENKKSNFSMPSRDYVMLQIGYTGLTNTPDSIKIGGIGRAFNAYICYDFPIKKTNLSFAAGAGISSNHYYLKNQAITLADTNGAIRFIAEPKDYKNYKYAVTYIEAPFELRYYENVNNKNVGFKAAIGLKVGAALTAHTRGKYTVKSKPIVDKEITKRFLEGYRYSLTARVGWGNFSVYGQYSLSNLFKVNSGPENIKPYQIGICISGL